MYCVENYPYPKFKMIYVELLQMQDFFMNEDEFYFWLPSKWFMCFCYWINIRLYNDYTILNEVENHWVQ